MILSPPIWSLSILLPLVLYQTTVCTLASISTRFDRYLTLLTGEEKKLLLNWIGQLDELSFKNLARTGKMEVKAESRFDPSELLSAFPGACVILTGDTEMMDFEHMALVPSIHTTGVASAKELRNASTRLVASFAKTVRQQLVIHKDEILSLPREQTPKLDLFPLTVVVVNTKLPYMTNALPPVLNVIEAFTAAADALVYLLSYDLHIPMIVDSRLSCPFCEEREEFKSTAGVSRPFRWTSQFKGGEGEGSTVQEKMHHMRSTAIFAGIRLRWRINQVFSKSAPTEVRDSWSRNSEGDAPKKYFDVKPGLDTMIIQALFPDLNRTTFPQQKRSSHYYCIVRRSNLNCKIQSPVSFQYEPVALVLSLEQEKLKESDVIFISSENIKEADGVTAADLFLKVVSCKVWMALLFSGLATATIYLLTDIVEQGSRKHIGSLPTFLKVDLLTVTCFYLLVGFLGQYSGEIHVPAKGSRSVQLIRFLVFPWLILHLLLPIWYTTFLQISFSLTHPYELETQKWQGFENHSVYFLESDAKFATFREKMSQSLNRFMEYLLWDVNNFNHGDGFASTIEIFDEKKMSDFRSTHYYDVTENPWYHSRYTKSYVLEYIFQPKDKIEDPADFPLLVWLKETLELCIARNRTCSNRNNFVHEASNQCLKEKFVLWKMMLRHEIIAWSQVNTYVGIRYQNKIQEARQQALQIKFQMHELEREWKQAEPNMSYGPCFVSSANMSFNFGCKNVLRDKYNKWLKEMEYNISSTFYWMVKRPEAVFVVTRRKFPWYWPLFQKIMRENPSLKFAHTGPIALRQDRRDKGLGGNGFESPVRVKGPIVSCLPEVKQMVRRIRALAHSGILGLYAKWNMILHPPLNKTEVRAMEEEATEVSALKMEDEILGYTFGMLVVGAGIVSAAVFILEMVCDNWETVIRRLYQGVLKLKRCNSASGI